MKGLSAKILKPASVAMAFVFSMGNLFGAEIIPSNRRVEWQGNAGVPSGFSVPTNCYTVMPAGSTRLQIQAALSASTNGSYVLLASGTFMMDDTLRLTSGKWLFGTVLDGTNASRINGAMGQPVSIGTWHSWEYETTVAASAKHTNWIAGFTMGTTVITLANASDFNVGQIIVLDSLNDTNASVFGNSASGNPYAIYEYTSEADLNNGHDRCQFQVNRIVGKSGNDLTLEHGLYKNFDPSLSPQAWRFAAVPVSNAGVANLVVEGNNADGTLAMDVAYGCTFSNVTVVATSARGYIFLRYAFRCAVRHCQVLAATTQVDSYGIRTRASSGILVENCWGDGLRAPFVPNGCSGSVWAYNFATNCQTASFYFQAGFLQHGGFPWANLYEGNCMPGAGADNVWGGSSTITWFRNRFTGTDSNPGGGHGNLQAAAIMSTNRFHNVVGNVLGNPSLTVYQDDGTTTCHDGRRVYFIGTYDPGSGCGGLYDPYVLSSMLRAVNWDSSTTTNGGIVLGGYTTNDLRASYYLASKPEWFGDRPWPPFDPASPATAVATNIPAGYRVVFGIDPPTGPVNLAPIVRASASSSSAFTNQPINFSSAGSSDPEGAPLTFNWSFGDNTTSTLANPSHSFSTDGTFNVRLTVSDGTNTIASQVLPILIRIPGVNYPPTASISASVSSGPAPLTVSFSSAGSADPDGTALSYVWNFGDATTSTAANPSHTYQTAGAYVARLSVSDGTNTVSSVSLTVSVGTQATGLQAAYAFEEGSGNVAGDLSGHTNSGTITGAAWNANGRFGKALSFGAGALVTVNDSASLDLTAMTLEAWVYPTAFNGSWMNLILKPTGDPSASSPSYALQGATASSGVPSVFVSPAPANLMAPSTLPLNKWSHIAATYDGTSIRLFVNGVLVNSTAQVGAIAPSTQPLTIGGNAFSGQNWTGLIDEVRIYNRALSATEIQRDMNTPVAGAAQQPPSPVNLQIIR
jgi:PKD repeat protein